MTASQYLSLIIGLPAAGLFAIGIALWLWGKLYSLDEQRERLARRLARKMADNVLHRAFDLSYMVTSSSGEQKVRYVKFVGEQKRKLREGVSLAADHPERYHTHNDHPDSYLTVWDWSTLSLEELPIAHVNLEIDTTRLPHDMALKDLLQRRQEIEYHAEAVLHNYGVMAVRMIHKKRNHRQSNFREITFQLIFRSNEKGPEIPQHVDFDEMQTIWEQERRDQIKYSHQEIIERQKLAARLLDRGITHYGATFPLKKLQADFYREISHRQIERLGQEFEDDGILQSVGGPHPRRIIVYRARQFIERLPGGQAAAVKGNSGKNRGDAARAPVQPHRPLLQGQSDNHPSGYDSGQGNQRGL